MKHTTQVLLGTHVHIIHLGS